MSDKHEDGQKRWTRRGWLSAAGAAVVGTSIADGTASALAAAQSAQKPATAAPLPLTEFEPKSMLHVAETTVQRARFPVIDFHTHVSRRRAAKPPVPPAELIKTMDA